MKHVLYGKCVKCGKTYDAVPDLTNCECGGILDLKCDPRLIGTLRESPGFLPAYHMNKANWITVLLDGSVSMEDLMPLLDLSYDLANGGRRRGPAPQS